MLEIMASQWSPWQRLLKNTEHLVFNEAPKLIRQLPKADSLQRGIQQASRWGWTPAWPPSRGRRAKSSRDHRRAAGDGGQCSHRSPRPQGDLLARSRRPGRTRRKSWWTWVVYEDDPTRGKGPSGAGGWP